jgi:hypothetical protein
MDSLELNLRAVKGLTLVAGAPGFIDTNLFKKL